MHHWLRKALNAPMIQQDHGVALSRRVPRRSRSGKPTPDDARDLNYLADRYP